MLDINLLLISLISAGSGLTGVFIGYRAVRKNALLETKRMAYGAVISNLHGNFRFRKQEEVDRIIGKAIALAEPELQALLKDYGWVIELYKAVVKPMRESIKHPTPKYFPKGWSQFEKTIRVDSKFRDVVQTIELLMRGEVMAKNKECPDVEQAMVTLENIKNQAVKANIPLRGF